MVRYDDVIGLLALATNLTSPNLWCGMCATVQYFALAEEGD